MSEQAFTVQTRTQADDGIGGHVDTWADYITVSGYIDLVTGTDQNTVQNAFTEQSTHILIVPKVPKQEITDKMRVVDSVGRFYVVNYPDDPMGQHHHLEIYLTYGGVVNG